MYPCATLRQDEIFPTSVVESGAVIYEKYITPAEGVEGPPEELDSFDASPSDVSVHNISTLLTDEELLDESCASTRGDQVAAHRRSASADGASGSNSNNASDGTETHISSFSFRSKFYPGTIDASICTFCSWSKQRNPS